jgi:VIT1/CCC1 family predicted Fe2+/Mn2+ transporter
MENNVPESTIKDIKQMQKNEITEYHIYQHIARGVKNDKEKKILNDIADDEKAHYDIWTDFLGEPCKPNRLKIFFYKILNFFFGYTFTLKIMEMGEEDAQEIYDDVGKYVDDAKTIKREEDEHEDELLNMLDEERLKYVGSMVLGLNDALVELSGTLAGLTFALGDPKLISLSGLITGIAASLSMAASEYLSAKTDNEEHPFKSAFYTGMAYILTVMLMVLPYLLLSNPYISLAIMLGVVVLIIFVFNFYISVAKNLNFKKRFLHMAAISLGVAVLSFGIGKLIQIFLGVSV